jgi:RNA polymerase sigma-70 factor (ECF subfamily)
VTALEQLAAELRPRLHRYCARLTGSVIDGEDAVQDALARALASPEAEIANREAWLFRIAHNAALDLLRKKAREQARFAEEVDVPDLTSDSDARIAAAASLRMFMQLPVTQRSAVLLMDVLGHSLEELATILDTSIPAVKAALHRGRTRLRELATTPEPPVVRDLTDADRVRLAAYIDRFNARDFDAVRNLLADDVRLDLVAHTKMAGKREVSRYFHNYSTKSDWHFAAGHVERRPAVIVTDPARPEAPAYFVLLGWRGDELVAIRDFRYARYVMDGAELA